MNHHIDLLHYCCTWTKNAPWPLVVIVNFTLHGATFLLNNIYNLMHQKNSQYLAERLFIIEHFLQHGTLRNNTRRKAVSYGNQTIVSKFFLIGITVLHGEAMRSPSRNWNWRYIIPTPDLEGRSDIHTHVEVFRPYHSLDILPE